VSVVVQKYGGSSLAGIDRLRAVAERVARTRSDSDRVVVVVSAMGDTTDRLTALAHQLDEPPGLVADCGNSEDCSGCLAGV